MSWWCYLPHRGLVLSQGRRSYSSVQVKPSQQSQGDITRIAFVFVKKEKMKAKFIDDANNNQQQQQFLSIRTQDALRNIVIKYLDYFYPKWVFTANVASIVLTILFFFSVLQGRARRL